MPCHRSLDAHAASTLPAGVVAERLYLQAIPVVRKDLQDTSLRTSTRFPARWGQVLISMAVAVLTLAVAVSMAVAQLRDRTPRATERSP